ncbi:chalcone isomerase family protein [Shewanella insulae]|uniref:chalcone isomerase family protein n=1 Tax=Shewanella insulae TaxID=2681496 RepID=UPI001EFD6D98|nr:chalcone isomerase family protein [Shewanella insulae]MCG9713281.1 chalcone isomerase family protein [Shewanella insulae]
MKSLLRQLLLITAVVSTPLAADTLADIPLADEIPLSEQALQLNGAGIRSKFFMDLYVGSLYTQSPSQTLDSVLNAPRVAIRLNIVSGMITSEKMQDAIIEGFDDATDGQSQTIQPQIDAFMALFSAPIAQGDQFTLEAIKDLGVTAYKNGEKQATVEGEAFRKALLKIWLGEKPAQKSLKRAMLGK